MSAVWQSPSDRAKDSAHTQGYELECYSCGKVGEIGEQFRLVSWGRQCCDCQSYEVHVTQQQRKRERNENNVLCVVCECRLPT